MSWYSHQRKPWLKKIHLCSMQGVSAVLFLVFPSTRPAGTVFCRLRLVAFTVNSKTEGWVPPNNDSCVCGPCGRVNLTQMGKKKWGVCLFVCLDLVLYEDECASVPVGMGYLKLGTRLFLKYVKKKNWIWILFILGFSSCIHSAPLFSWNVVIHTHTFVCKKANFIKDEAWKVKLL